MGGVDDRLSAPLVRIAAPERGRRLGSVRVGALRAGVVSRPSNLSASGIAANGGCLRAWYCLQLLRGQLLQRRGLDGTVFCPWLGCGHFAGVSAVFIPAARAL